MKRNVSNTPCGGSSMDVINAFLWLAGFICMFVLDKQTGPVIVAMFWAFPAGYAAGDGLKIAWRFLISLRFKVWRQG